MIKYRPCESACTYMNMDASVSDAWLALVHGATKVMQSLIAEESKCAQTTQGAADKSWLLKELR